MRSYSTYILIASAALLTAIGCNKAPQPSYVLTDSPIMLSATEADTDAPFRKGSTPATKAMLDEDTFAAAGNEIKVYDYYTSSANATEIYIDDTARSGGDITWPFVEKRYNWTTDGTHKFFGWLAKDVNMGNMTPEDFFGNDFAFSNQVLTTGTKTINASTEFDFMYSNVHVRDLNTTPDFASAVPLEFAHLFTAFSVAAQNMSPNFDITVQSITIEGLMNTRSATLDYANAADGEYPTVEYANKSNDNQADYSFAPAQKLGTNLMDMSTTTTDRKYFMSWPMSADEAENVTLTIKYTVNDEPTVITKPIPLSGKEWVAGKKNNINLIFKDKEIILQCLVMDWIPQEEIIDFSDQVSVNATMEWDRNTVRSVNNQTGEVILYDDTNVKATCTFHIETPKGATWTASLIPIEGHQDAFVFLDGTKYGEVGGKEASVLKVGVTNQAPIAPRHVCILRITVQTADGRTIVVKNLVPGKQDAEFKIIQNLING